MMMKNSAIPVAKWIHETKDTVAIESVHLSGPATFQCDVGGENRFTAYDEWQSVNLVLITDMGKVEVEFDPPEEVIRSVIDQGTRSKDRRRLWGYSNDKDSRFLGAYHSPERAIEDAASDLSPDSSSPIYIARGIEKDPREYFDSETIVEDIKIRASELAEQQVGEAVEDFPDISEDARRELMSAIDRVLDVWVAKHVKCDFYETECVWRVYPRMHQPWDNAELVRKELVKETSTRIYK